MLHAISMVQTHYQIHRLSCIYYSFTHSADVSSSKTSSVSTNVMISHTGNVTWLSTVIYRSSCAVDVRYVQVLRSGDGAHEHMSLVSDV